LQPPNTLTLLLRAESSPPVCGMLVAGGFCYGRLLDESGIARESQNSPDSCACLRPASFTLRV